jgi:CheY-like chemotaxis protein
MEPPGAALAVAQGQVPEVEPLTDVICRDRVDRAKYGGNAMSTNVDCRVLVAEDEPDTLRGLVRMLGQRGYQVESAGGGIEAAEKLRGGLFDVVVSDLKMPDMSGMDLLRLTRKTSAETVFVMITAYGTTASAEEARKLGAFDYIDKPFNMEDLVGAIEEGRRQAAEAISVADEPVSEVVESPPMGQWLRSAWHAIQELDLDPALNVVVGLARDAFGAQLGFDRMSPKSEGRGVAERGSATPPDAEPRIPLYGGVYLVPGSWGTLEESERTRLVQFLRRVALGKLVPLR